MNKYKSIEKALLKISGGTIEADINIEEFDWYYVADENVQAYLEIPYKSTEGKWKFEITYIDHDNSFTGETEEIIVLDDNKKDEADIAMELFSKVTDYLWAENLEDITITLDSDIYKAGQSVAEYNSNF